MTERISLVEAYDNRDVIAQLVRLRDNVDELMNILKDIDPNGDLTNVVTKTGDQTIDGVKTFIGQIVADCDIIQNGAAYETHAEQIFSHNDYIVMRDGAVNSLPAGSYSGLQVKKYDGTNDCRLVVDNTGIARVGDINDEKPLMVRDEAADLTGGDVLLWDDVNLKAIGQAKDSSPASGSSACVTSDGIYTALLAKMDNPVNESVTFTKGSNVNTIVRGEVRYDGRMVVGSIQIRLAAGGIAALTETIVGTLSKPAKYANGTIQAGATTNGNICFVWVDGSNVKIYSKNALATNEEIGMPFNYLVDQ